MTDHYFQHSLVNLHYYKFGNGPKTMLCFHGYGMHGKQFTILEKYLGDKYTFYGFDLFFHKQTLLADQSLKTVKGGLPKSALADMVIDFCSEHGIDQFSVIGYSMGSHYATVVTEELANRVDEFILLAPAAIDPGKLVRFFSKNRMGNRLLRRITASDKTLLNTITLAHKLHFIDKTGHEILMKEFGTAQLRFAFYACFTYLRFFGTDEVKLLQALNNNRIKSIFVFGKHDMMYPPRIGKKLLPKIDDAKVIVLENDHNLINDTFAAALTELL